jgi:hypothetical protein
MATTGLQSSGKVLHSKGRALALASAKAHHQSPTLFRNAEALLPSAEAEGSHQSGVQDDSLRIAQLYSEVQGE